jgi:hypothetical protein
VRHGVRHGVSLAWRLAPSAEWSDTPLKAWQGPAAAHLVAPPMPPTPSTRAGGQDDGSYTNSLKLNTKYANLNTQY